MKQERAPIIGKKARLDEIREAVERGKRLGLISGPADGPTGYTRPLKIEGAPAAAHGSVRVQFIDVTPDLAKRWLHHNLGNRSLRDTTVEAYARDMIGGEWLLNHQGIAFNDQERLIDGQHRLAAIVRSGVTVTLLVSHGWPSKPQGSKSKAKLMDTVDRGAPRSLKDLLELQHACKHPHCHRSGEDLLPRPGEEADDAGAARSARCFQGGHPGGG
jgi:hypothetical protein